MSIKLGTQSIKMPYAKVYLGSNKVYEGSAYTLVDYITSVSDKYFDTGIKIKPNTKIELEATYVPTTAYYFGAFGVKGSAPTIYVNANSNYLRITYGANQQNRTLMSNGSNISPDDRFLLVADNTMYQVKNKSTTPEKTVQYTPSTTNTSTGTINMLVLGNNYRGSPRGSRSNDIKLYGCKIYESASLVAYFQPAKDSNNIECLYESVSDSLIYAQQGE
jgi:hypothetical protein